MDIRTDRGRFETATDLIHDLRAGDLPEEVLHMARRCVLDTLGVWAAGSATQASRIARDHAARRYLGTVPMPFDGRAVNPVGYAFAGAASVDAMDGHDGHEICKGHASVALLPALLAELGDDPGCTMDDLLTDFVMAQEVSIRAGLALHDTVPDYHSSGAWNALGCAAIAARRRGMTHEQTRQALGIAEYYGPRAQMMRCIDAPSMVKDSSSWGALAGVSAADLAEDGFTGAPALTCEAPEVAALWSDLGQRWRILESNFKAYPVCRWAHPAVEAVLALMHAHDLTAGDIAEIEITTFHAATRLSVRRPEGGDAAQYSLPVSVALAALHGTILPQHLLPESYDRDEVWQLVDEITLRESDDFTADFPAKRQAEALITTTDGRHLRSAPAEARGTHEAPLSDAELLEKFEAFTAPILPADRRNALARILSDPSNAPAPRELIALLQV